MNATTRKLFLAMAALCLTVTAPAQRLTAPQAGQRLQLPQLHASRQKTAPAQQPRVVMAQGSRSAAPRHAIADADAARFEGRTVYGNMVNSDQWANMSITQVPYGIYSFTMGSAEAPKAHITDMNYNFMAGAWGRDRHYGIVPLSILGAINGARYITIDTRDWREQQNVMWSTEHGTYSLVASTMAYDPTDDTFYAFQYKEDLSGLNWVRLNLDTDQMEQIAQYRGNTSVVALAATTGGTMYYIDAAGDLYTVNKRSGRTSLVGNTGVVPSPYNQAMVFDGKTATFLWAAQSSEGSVLYSVDPATATTQRVMRFRNNEQFVSLYITDSEAPADAPAAVGRPQLRPEANGTTTASLNFTVPSRTFGGETLTGSLNLNVWLDGENIKGEPAEPGTSMQIPVSVEEGNHYIAITTDNDAGFSPLRYIYQYLGYDTPQAVTDALFAQADGQNTVTWKAPTAGVNAGYIDAAALTYDVLRMPDSIVVATALTATTFTEPTPAAMHAYSYRITASNHGHQSAGTETNQVLCGNSFTVPYKQLFSDPVTLKDYFTVVDRDGDGNTWRQGYTNEVRLDYMHNADADDWLISPPISLEAGMKYRFAMNMKIFTPNYPEDFEVLIGTDPDDLSTFTLVTREEDFTEIASEYADYTTDFFVAQTQDYHMAVRYCSKKDSKASLMMINSFAVNAVGNSAAPAQPTLFAITPDADDALKATVSMTAPTLNLMGDAITSLATIELYRDDAAEPIHTFDAPQPGEQLSYTDEQVPSVGLHTYTAVATSTDGRGEPVSAEQFIGIYAAPYYEDFEDRKYGELWTGEYSYDDDINSWYGWKWTDNTNTYGRHLNLYYYLQSDTPTEIWLFSPRMKMEADAVYTVSFDANMNYSYYPDMSYGLYQGSAPHSADMTTLVTDLPSTDYSLSRQEHILVNSETGRYHLGIKANGATKADYFNASIDNFALTYRTSAFAPRQMTAFRAAAATNGELKAQLTLTAPKTNYYQQALSKDEPLTISIYRGQNATMPAHTLQCKPGEHITWTDEQALHGLNYYTVTCENSYGRGETISDTLFVGRDVPDVVGNFAVRGSADNKDAVITWSRPTAGANGGVVIGDETIYNVYDYNPTTGDLTLLADSVSGTTYTVERSEQTEQQMHYYAVSAQNSEGEGQALAASIVLGTVYDLPFSESFAGAELATQLWQSVPMIEGATSAGLDNPSSEAGYNKCNGPQDNDGGCAYIYNGNQYEVYAGALLVTPKVRLAPVEGNELRFWAYHFKENYQVPAYVQVGISANDSQFANITTAKFELGGTTEKGWTEHVVNLDRYRTSHFIALALLGITGGYQDVIYLDNVSITNDNASGISTVGSGQHPQDLHFYDLQGRQVDPATYRGIVVAGGKKLMLK